MHSIWVTYDTRQGRDVGEAGCSLPICDELYDQLLNNEHDIEHNLIEPALLEKPIVCGSVLRNFRFLLDVLRNADAVRTADTEEELFDTLDTLFADDNLRTSLGKRAGAAVKVHAGATNKIITLLEETIQ